MYHHLLPVIGTCVYLNFPKHIRIDSNILHGFSVFHNIFLAVFSGYTCASLIALLYQDGLQYGHMIYLNDTFQTKYDSIIFWFYISKYYEYLDTILLYLQNKNPIFLQKFHHVGAVISWHLCYYYKVDAMVVGSLLNSGVHTVMYSYYLLSLFKIRLTSIKPLITTGQILQLIGGNVYSAVYYYPPVETIWNYSIIVSIDVYIAVLIYLFGQFYWNNYIVKKLEKKSMKKNENLIESSDITQ